MYFFGHLLCFGLGGSSRVAILRQVLAVKHMCNRRRNNRIAISIINRTFLCLYDMTLVSLIGIILMSTFCSELSKEILWRSMFFKLINMLLMCYLLCLLMLMSWVLLLSRILLLLLLLVRMRVWCLLVEICLVYWFWHCLLFLLLGFVLFWGWHPVLFMILCFYLLLSI